MKSTKVPRRLGWESQKREQRTNGPFLKALNQAALIYLERNNWNAEKGKEAWTTARAESEALQEPELRLPSRDYYRRMELLGLLESEGRGRSKYSGLNYALIQKRVRQLIKEVTRDQK